MESAGSSSSIFPKLLKQILQKFNFLNNEQTLEKSLLDLNTLLGKTLVQAALHLIDHQTITIYTNKPKTLEIVEILETNSSPGIVRLLNNLNYCTCKYFKNEVLLKAQSTTGSYTCKHVIALRLAFVLKHKCLVYKEVPCHQLDLLMQYFLPETTIVASN